MASHIGTLITATDYNNVHLSLHDILGLGENGYGLPLIDSDPIDTSGNVTITAFQWNHLLSDVNKVYQHITNVLTSTQVIVTGTVVSSSFIDGVEPAVEWCYDNARRYTCHPSQFYVDPEANTSTFYADGVSLRTLPWGILENSITHRVLTQFENRLSARYYFNLGCFLTFTPYYEEDTGLNDLDAEWADFIDYLRAPAQEYRYSRSDFITYSSTVTSWSSGTLSVSVTADKSVDESAVEFIIVYSNNASATLIVSPAVATWAITV